MLTTPTETAQELRKRSEEASRVREQFLRATIDGLGAHVCVINKQGQIVITNRAWNTFAAENNAAEGTCGEGASYLEACRTPSEDEKADIEEFAAAVRGVIDGSLTEFAKEYPCHSPHKKRWFICRINSFKVSETNYAVISHENITERRLAEMELQLSHAQLDEAHQTTKKSNELLSAILENMSDWIWEVDAEGRYTYCSKHAEMHLGYTVDEMIGKTPFDFMPPEQAERIGIQFMEICQGKLRIQNLENWNITKDGRRILLLTNGVPILGADGALIGYRGVDRDITELRRYEAELRKLSRAVQQSPVSTVITDTLGSIEFVNPKFTELTGYTAEEAIGQSPRILNAGQTPPETFVDLWATITSGKTWKGELLNKTKEGTLFWEMAIITPLYDENGVITHYLAVKEDITEKKEILKQLKAAKVQADAASEAKSSFLATMSHEIRTPMNGVVGMSSLLLETGLSAVQRDYAEIISRSGENLLILIDEILDFSKIEAGKLDLEPAFFDLHLIMDDINRLLSYRADNAGIVLSYNIEPGVPKVLKGDPGRVRQVITNLVGNALKFTEHGSIAVNASLVSDQDGFVTIRFAISDTGIGIPESRLSAIFAPFTQVDASTTRKYGGTGLGLAICKQLAELMGGEIGVTSEEGKGSTFWFTARFEKQGVEAMKAAQEATAHTPRVVGSLDDLTARILLVEDNIVNQKVALHLLKALGYTADIAADGQQAVDALAMINYDLVLMDCMMPNMNGFEATAIIRAPGSAVLNHNVPIIAMTANAMKEDRDKCLESGMDDYVSKPVKKETLAAVLEKWLSQTDLLRKKNIDVGTQDLDRLSRLTVLYVEDDEMTREMYSLFLSSIVGELITAKNGAEGLEAYHKHHPDIIITDIMMPVMDGLEMLKHVHSSNTTIPAIILSAVEASDSLNQSNDIGVVRHETKSLSRAKLKVTLLECANDLWR